MKNPTNTTTNCHTAGFWYTHLTSDNALTFCGRAVAATYNKFDPDRFDGARHNTCPMCLRDERTPEPSWKRRAAA